MNLRKFLLIIAIPSITLVPAVLAETNYPQPSASGVGLTYDQVETLIEQQNPKSVEEALALLPKGAFDQYALVYSSRSLQGATPSNPRAIVYGKNGLTFAFNGDSKEDGYNTLEFMQFDSSTKKFEFHEVNFSGGKAAISKPDTCLKCHGDNSHPIWDSYFFWPGVYGSEDAELVGDEKKNLEGWANSRAAHTRYKYLNPSAIEFGTKTPDGHSVTLGAQSLGMYLSRENFQAIATDLQADTKLRPFRYALLAAGSCPDMSIDDFLPANVKARAAQSFKNVSDQVAQAIKRSFSSRADRVDTLDDSGDHETRVAAGIKEVAAGSNLSDFDNPALIARYRYLVENFGSVTPNWSLEFKPPGSGVKTYAMDDGYRIIGGLPDLWKSMLSPTDDTDLYPMYEAVTSYPHIPLVGACAKLKEKSLATLGKIKAPDQASASPIASIETKSSVQALSGGTVFKTCIQCHSNSEGLIPHLPFNDPDLLKTKLGQPGYPRGTLEQEIRFRIDAKGGDQMPPTGGLAPSDVAAIKTYLDQIDHE